MIMTRGIRCVSPVVGGAGGEVVGGGCSGSSEISPSAPVLSPQQRLARKEENRKNVFFTSLK